MADQNKYLGPVLIRELNIATQLLDVTEQKAVIDALAVLSNLSVFPPVTITTAAYNPTVADAGSYLRHTFNGAKTSAINADATFGQADPGTRIKGRVANTGSLTFSAGAGATLNAPGGTLVVPANATYDLVKVAANTWDLSWSA